MHIGNQFGIGISPEFRSDKSNGRNDRANRRIPPVQSSRRPAFVAVGIRWRINRVTKGRPLSTPNKISRSRIARISLDRKRRGEPKVGDGQVSKSDTPLPVYMNILAINITNRICTHGGFLLDGPGAPKWSKYDSKSASKFRKIPVRRYWTEEPYGRNITRTSGSAQSYYFANPLGGIY